MDVANQRRSLDAGFSVMHPSASQVHLEAIGMNRIRPFTPQYRLQAIEILNSWFEAARQREQRIGFANECVLVARISYGF
jgi:hypothetical protein